MEGCEARISAEAPGERASGPYEWRITSKCAEEPVDVVHHTGFSCSGVLVGGDQAGARCLHDRVLVLVKESGHERV
jgi:hypothetical protein